MLDLEQMILASLTKREKAAGVQGVGDEAGHAASEGSGQDRSLCVGALIRSPTSTATGTRFSIVASTSVRDRTGEVISHKDMGWVIPQVMPKVLYGHNPYAFPIGKILKVTQTSRRLVLDIELADAVEGHADAVVAAGLIRGGFLDQGSVGFKPIEWTDADGTQRSAAAGDSAWMPEPGRVFTKQELYEFSITPIPANPESVVLALRHLNSGRPGVSMLDAIARSVLRQRAIGQASRRARASIASGPPAGAGGAQEPQVVCPACVEGDGVKGEAFAVIARLSVLPAAGADARVRLLHAHIATHYEAWGMAPPPAIGSTRDAFNVEWIRQYGVAAFPSAAMSESGDGARS